MTCNTLPLEISAYLAPHVLVAVYEFYITGPGYFQRVLVKRQGKAVWTQLRAYLPAIHFTRSATIKPNGLHCDSNHILRLKPGDVYWIDGLVCTSWSYKYDVMRAQKAWKEDGNKGAMPL
jgi:hypothetical protein